MFERSLLELVDTYLNPQNLPALCPNNHFEGSFANKNRGFY